MTDKPCLEEDQKAGRYQKPGVNQQQQQQEAPTQEGKSMQRLHGQRRMGQIQCLSQNSRVR